MHSLLTIDELTRTDIEKNFALASSSANSQSVASQELTGAYSFEGNSIRTRSTFLKALLDLGIRAIEAPNLLKTAEPVEHLAGYLDNWIDLYIIQFLLQQPLADTCVATGVHRQA